ncbi:MAG: imidazole glycerol phosphate synthase subunit HisH [Pseudomonadota bacterium]
MDTSKLRVLIVDYGVGNVQSIRNALLHVADVHVDISSDHDLIRQSDCLILPGVGAYRDAMSNLREHDLIEVLGEQVCQQQKPVLGVCLGMQLLFEHSEEGGGYDGLGWIKGSVKYMEVDKRYRVPHVGWNDLILKRESTFFEGLNDDRNFYFVHGYHVVCADEFILATFEYGREFAAAVQCQNIVGMQFHPERSHSNGLHAMNRFVTWARSSLYA